MIRHPLLMAIAMLAAGLFRLLSPKWGENIMIFVPLVILTAVLIKIVAYNARPSK